MADVVADNQCTDNQLGWRAGIARVNITPPLHVYMTGFSGRTSGAIGIRDQIYVTALVLAVADTKVAIVTCDLLALDGSDVDIVRRHISNETGIPVDYVMVHTTHTHSGPLACSMRDNGPRDAAYESILWRQIVSAAVLADQRLQPARLMYGTAAAPIGVNRRQLVDDRIVIGENPAGPYDNRVTVLGIWPTEGELHKPIGLLLSAAVHPVMFRDCLISRDFYGFALNKLEQAFPGATCLYLSGPCGDINPLHMRVPDSYAMAQRHGETLAGAAMVAMGTSRPLEAKYIVGAQQRVRVPLQPLPPREELEKEKATEVGAGRANSVKSRWLNAALVALGGSAGAPPEDFEVDLQCIVIGDVALTMLPFETFTMYGAAVAQSAPASASLLVGCTNGVYGYLPTADAFPLGGYEVDKSYQYYGQLVQALSPDAPAVVLAGIKALHAKVKNRGEIKWAS